MWVWKMAERFYLRFDVPMNKFPRIEELDGTSCPEVNDMKSRGVVLTYLIASRSCGRRSRRVPRSSGADSTWVRRRVKGYTPVLLLVRVS